MKIITISITISIN